MKDFLRILRIHPRIHSCKEESGARLQRSCSSRIGNWTRHGVGVMHRRALLYGRNLRISDMEAFRNFMDPGNLRHLTAGAALAVLGGGVGWFVGQSGSDAVVLAAVLPAVLSGGGVLIVLRSEDRYEHRHGIIVNASVAVFVAFIVLGSLLGNANRLKTEEENLSKELEGEQKYRATYLEQCSNQELKVNNVRAALGLSPLPSQVFCR